MVFSSSLFLFLFLPITILLYYNPFCSSRVFRNSILLIVSLAFYAWGEPLFVFLMLISIFLNWIIGILMTAPPPPHSLHISPKKTIRFYLSPKTLLILSLIFNIGLLFVFKYLSFLSDNLHTWFPSLPFPKIEIALPIGISFFTFQIMSYIFDVYYKKVPVQKNLFDLALYISMFPQLIAGPIVRYETVAYEIGHRKETAENITEGSKRFVFGLAKKCLLANYMAVIADNIFLFPPDQISIATAWLGIIAYTLQIYFDFSGYSDMAIGLGLIFGFHFNENFNYPYAAKSITDFWRRWHISLSSWFRDYVYIPLGGNRCSKTRWIFNLFTVWALTGIWHGAAWTFWIWGIYYFFLLLIEKETKISTKTGIFGHFYALFFVMIGWVFFRSPSLSFAWEYIKSLFSGNFYDSVFIYYLQNGGWFLVVALIFAFPIVPFVKRKWFSFPFKESVKTKISEYVTYTAVFVLFAVSVLSCIKASYNPFIYFNF